MFSCDDLGGRWTDTVSILEDWVGSCSNGSAGKRVRLQLCLPWLCLFAGLHLDSQWSNDDIRTAKRTHTDSTLIWWPPIGVTDVNNNLTVPTFSSCSNSLQMFLYLPDPYKKKVFFLLSSSIFFSHTWLDMNSTSVRLSSGMHFLKDMPVWCRQRGDYPICTCQSRQLGSRTRGEERKGGGWRRMEERNMLSMRSM